MNRNHTKTSFAGWRLTLMMAAMSTLAGNTSAAELTVIANPNVEASEISNSDLRAVFLGTKTQIKENTVKPVLGKSGSAHEAFLKDYIGKTEIALQTYYRSLVFTGKLSMPMAFATDEQIIAYVAQTRGAIGYIKSGAVPTSVKTLHVK